MVFMKNKEILDEVDKLVEMIKSSDKYCHYQDVLDKMKKNDQINDLIDSYKEIQKQLVKATIDKRKDEIISLEEKLKVLDQELLTYPIYVEYLTYQEELDQLFQHIKYSLEDYFDRKLNA